MRHCLTAALLVLVFWTPVPATQVDIPAGLGRCLDVAASESGFLVVGEVLNEADGAEPGSEPLPDGLAAEVAADGQLLWVRTYGGDGRDTLAAVAACPGGAYLAGQTDSFGQGGTDAWVVRTGEHGAQLWQTFLGGPDDDFASGIVSLKDGGCLVAMRRVTDQGQEMRLVRLNKDGREVWSGPKELMPVGVPARLLRLPPAAGGKGTLRAGGFALAGTAFVRQCGSQPFVMTFDPKLRVLDMLVPAQSGSAPVMTVDGPGLLSAWTSVSDSGAIGAGAARLTDDGHHQIPLPQAVGERTPFGIATAETGVTLLGLNSVAVGRSFVRLLALLKEQSGERFVPSERAFADRVGAAVAVSGETLAVAGSTAGREARPWLELVSRGEWDGESLAAGTSGPDDTVEELVTVDRSVDGLRIEGGTREVPDSAWPQPFVRLTDRNGRIVLDQVLPYPAAQISTAIPLVSGLNLCALGLNVPSTPGPAEVRALVVGPAGILVDRVCVRLPGQVRTLSEQGRTLTASGVIADPEGDSEFTCRISLSGL